MKILAEDPENDDTLPVGRETFQPMPDGLRLAGGTPSGSNAVAELSNYQQKVVKRYYEHLDTALLQRLGERVTDLYLAEGKKREKLWAGVATALEKLGVPHTRIARLTASDDPRQLASMVQELLAKA